MFERAHRVPDHGRREKGQISLHVDNQVGLQACGDLGQAVCPGRMIGPGHGHLATHGPYRSGNPLIIGRHHHPVHARHLAGLLVDMLNHRLATQQGQRFSWKTRRAVACRNESDNFHTQAIFGYTVKFLGNCACGTPL